MKKVKYPIKFLCKTSGNKFKASCKVDYDDIYYVYYGVGNTLKEAVNSLIESLNNYSSFTYKCIKKRQMIFMYIMNAIE